MNRSKIILKDRSLTDRTFCMTLSFTRTTNVASATPSIKAATGDARQGSSPTQPNPNARPYMAQNIKNQVLVAFEATGVKPFAMKDKQINLKLPDSLWIYLQGKSGSESDQNEGGDPQYCWRNGWPSTCL